MATRLTAGIDVGGTRIKALALDAEGAVRRSHSVSTPPNPGPAMGSIIAGVLRSLIDCPDRREQTSDRIGAIQIKRNPTGGNRSLGVSERAGGEQVGVIDRVGVVVPGLVDDARGQAIWSANLGWRELPLRELLSTSLDVPVAVGHDVRAGLLAEVQLGAARNVRDVMFVPLGTGIAAAMMANGIVVAGSPWAGEIGHVVVDPTGPQCRCGRRGCLEAIASATAICRQWQSMGRAGDARVVVEAVVSGDREARELWGRAIEAMSRVFAPVCAAAGTRLLLLGGGLALAGPPLLDPLRERLAHHLGHDDVEVAVAQLGDQAGALGAALIAQEAFA